MSDFNFQTQASGMLNKSATTINACGIPRELRAPTIRPARPVPGVRAWGRTARGKCCTTKAKRSTISPGVANAHAPSQMTSRLSVVKRLPPHWPPNSARSRSCVGRLRRRSKTIRSWCKYLSQQSIFCIIFFVPSNRSET
jgi:hypothetical protein